MYYNNITIIKGTQETIENLTSSLIDVKGQVVTLNSYKTNPYYTEVIEIDDYKTYGDTDSEDECLEITFAALGYPVVRFWESDDFAITQKLNHIIPQSRHIYTTTSAIVKRIQRLYIWLHFMGLNV